MHRPVPRGDVGDRALDEVRRETWNDARRDGMKAHAKELKGARFALWRNPEDLTKRQEAKLAWIAQVNRRLYRAYLLKEQLRLILHVKDQRAIGMLQKWIAWAARSRIPPFVDLARRIRANLPGIAQALLNNLSNALIESTNTKLRRNWIADSWARGSRAGEAVEDNATGVVPTSGVQVRPRPPMVCRSGARARATRPAIGSTPCWTAVRK